MRSGRGSSARLIGLSRRALRRGGPLLVAVAVLAVFALERVAPPLASPAPGAQQGCRSLKVADGDTLDLQCGGVRVRVRVWGIDAPELAQRPWGERARGALERAVDGVDLALEVVDTDVYGRTVARVLRDGADVGLALVEDGWVARYPRYNDSAEYARVEAQARTARRGIWAEAGAHQQPWRWRRVNPRQGKGEGT